MTRLAAVVPSTELLGVYYLKACYVKVVSQQTKCLRRHYCAGNLASDEWRLRLTCYFRQLQAYYVVRHSRDLLDPVPGITACGMGSIKHKRVTRMASRVCMIQHPHFDPVWSMDTRQFMNICNYTWCPVPVDEGLGNQ